MWARTSCRWIKQYQNLQQWSVAHCDQLQNSLVMLSLYVGASVVQSPPVGSNLCDGQGYVVLFEQASNTFYVTMDTVHVAAITAAIVPLLTMKVYFEGFPSTSSRYMALQPLTACVLSPPEWYLGVCVCVYVCVTDCVYMYMYV